MRVTVILLIQIAIMIPAQPIHQVRPILVVEILAVDLMEAVLISSDFSFSVKLSKNNMNGNFYFD